MTIGVDGRELVGKWAGKGWYVYHILEHWAKTDKNNNYVIYGYKECLAPLPVHHRLILINKGGLGWHWAVKKRLKADGVDVYWAPTSPIVPALSPIPTVITLADLTILLFPEQHVLKNRLVERAFMGRAIKRTAKVLAISAATQADVNRLFPGNEAKTTVVPLGVDEVFQPMGKPTDQACWDKYGLKPGYVLFVGTLEPRKNITTLIQAYSGLEKSGQARHPLVIVGKKGWFYEAIFNEVRKNNLTNRIKFLGYVPAADLPAIYRGAKVFAYPSLYEGFGLPVLEAMACGVPAITSNISSLPEVAGEAAITVPPKDKATLARYLEQLLGDDREWRRRRAAGLEQARRFSWSKTAEQTLGYITECKADPKSKPQNDTLKCNFGL